MSARAVPLHVISAAKLIKLFITDVDGVLTDGGIIYDDNGIETKRFHVHDGLGLKLLQQAGIIVGIITSRESKCVTKRMNEIGIAEIHQNAKQKHLVLQQLLTKYNLISKQVAYMGDDLPDLPIILQVGLGIAVSNACDPLRSRALWTTENHGGHGAVREAANLILDAQGLWPSLLKPYETQHVPVA